MDSQNAAANNAWVAALRMALRFCNTRRHHHETDISRSQLDGDYYWVPGTWLLAPEPGFLWTPGYWAWRDGVYVFHEGYWGPRVGFYGGVNYGFGYGGRGYEGGRWDNGHFFYNRSVNNVTQTIVKNVYNTTVENNTTINRVSCNGGNGGVEARATAEETAAERDRHIPPLAMQTQHAEAARTNPQLRATAPRMSLTV
jgi:WXXGXW repeat (2 copies)